jgi:hypothetical protein
LDPLDPDIASFLSMDFLLKKYRNALQDSFRNKESLRQDKLREMELSLNNLNYHKQHLQVEIQKCTSYESIYQHLDVEPTSLEAELDMRTALSLQISEMKQQKIIKLKAIQDKQRELNELEAQLLVFVDSTKELQQRFGTDAAVLDQNYSKSQLLPKPLFVLYRHCLGYQQWTQNMLSVEIVDEPGQSLDYYSCHNLSVSIILMSNAKPLIKLRFCYLVQLETIIVKPELIEQFDNVPAALFSHNIFPGDDGKEACNTKLLFLDDGKFKFDYEFCQGYAYSWAQYVCGFYYPRSIDLKTNDSCTWILNDNGQPTVPFFSKVIELVTEKRAIAVQINSALASMTLKPQFAGLKSQKTPNCRISMFKRMEVY